MPIVAARTGIVPAPPLPAPPLASAPAEPRVFSVAQVVRAAHQTLLKAQNGQESFWVRGEVSGWKRTPTGHCYFTLKDDDAELACVMWCAVAEQLVAYPRDGMEVLVRGEVGVWVKKGRFQLQVTRLETTGAGGLWEVARNELIDKLRREGLLTEERKRSLPRIPERVGLVTSMDGAAVQDLFRALRRRAWWIPATLSPTPVEGIAAAPHIARAIRRFGRTREVCPVDVLIVARGGGSIESLWGFNTEEVARAIADCPVPVISAVGHETDYTVADLVADERAATPTAGAALAVPDGREIAARVHAHMGETAPRVRVGTSRCEQRVWALGGFCQRGFERRLSLTETGISEAERHLEARSPAQLMARAEAQVEHTSKEIQAALRRRIRAGEERVARAERDLGIAWATRLETAETRVDLLSLALERHAPRTELARREAEVDRLHSSIRSAVRRRLSTLERDISGTALQLAARSPARGIQRAEARLDQLSEALDSALRTRLHSIECVLETIEATHRSRFASRLESAEQILAHTADALDARSPFRVLARGYALVSDAESGRPVRSAADLHGGQRVRLRLAEGEAEARIEPRGPILETTPPADGRVPGPAF